jgi:ABC-type uncharacterized transport system substrate-binding protein
VPSILVVVVLLAVAVIAEAQQPKKVPRIGYLTATSLSAVADRTEAFRDGLRELGYVEGKNIVIEWRSAEGNSDRQRALAAELVRLKVDLIVSGGSSSTRFAKEATNATPIVMAQDTDPVKSTRMRWQRSPQGEGGRPRGTHHKRTRAGHRAGDASHRGVARTTSRISTSGWPSHEPEVRAV